MMTSSSSVMTKAASRGGASRTVAERRDLLGERVRVEAERDGRLGLADERRGERPAEVVSGERDADDRLAAFEHDGIRNENGGFPAGFLDIVRSEIGCRVSDIENGGSIGTVDEGGEDQVGSRLPVDAAARCGVDRQ